MANKGNWNPRWRQPATMAGVAGIAAAFGLAGAMVVLGRETRPAPAPIITNNSAGVDPAYGNMAGSSAPVAFRGPQASSALSQRVRVLPVSAAYAPQQASETYPAGQQTPAPIVRGNNAAQNESLQYNTQPPTSEDAPNAQDPNAYDANALQAYNDQGYTDGSAQEDAGYDALEQADQAPPALPEYDQPPAPDDNYLWTPGYWGYSTGYYWVPGAWVAPPFYGALWTPPWWGWYGGRYYLHRGYWGNHIGYYGGINYGHGYVGSGFYGGYWQGRNFFYNRSVTNVNVSRVHNVYERTVTVNNTVYNGRSANRLSFNGPGGVQVRPRTYETNAMREAHYAPVPAQIQSRRQAATDRGQFFSQNHGRPSETFQQRPLSSTSAIADSPQRAPFNRGGAIQGQPAVQGQRNAQGSYNRQPGGAAAEANRPSLGTNNGNGPRNEMIQQRNGLWGANRDRNAANGQQQPVQQLGQPQPVSPNQQQNQPGQQDQRQRYAAGQDRNQQWQQQRDANAQGQRDQQMQQQRNLQLQQQQGRDAALQQQRDVQQSQQQQRNLQWQRQREASEQVRNQQMQQQQQQRNGLEQQQRNAAEQQQRSAQMQQQQQQRMADQQQRNMQFQQQQQQRAAEQQQRAQQYQQQQQQRQQMAPQHIDARPSPQQHMDAPHPQQQFSGMHGHGR